LTAKEIVNMAFAIATEPTASIPLVVSDEQVIYVGHPRVTLDTVVDAFLDGATPEEINYQYPSLSLADIYAVVGYYLHHRSEVEMYLKQREQQAEQVRQQNEEHFPPEGVRARLLTRHQMQQR
jgi:uncharacterized protein (DUF433 family)